jgi:hypothetical protein
VTVPQEIRGTSADVPPVFRERNHRENWDTSRVSGEVDPLSLPRPLLTPIINSSQYPVDSRLRSVCPDVPGLPWCRAPFLGPKSSRRGQPQDAAKGWAFHVARRAASSGMPQTFAHLG